MLVFFKVYSENFFIQPRRFLALHYLKRHECTHDSLIKACIAISQDVLRFTETKCRTWNVVKHRKQEWICFQNCTISEAQRMHNDSTSKSVHNYVLCLTKTKSMKYTKHQGKKSTYDMTMYKKEEFCASKHIFVGKKKCKKKHSLLQKQWTKQKTKCKKTKWFEIHHDSKSKFYYFAKKRSKSHNVIHQSMINSIEKRNILKRKNEEREEDKTERRKEKTKTRATNFKTLRVPIANSKVRGYILEF